jgi:NADH-quinone oxidoreductase subunit G
MPSIKIGDKVCQFEGKKTILQVALENGVEIPHYCYHPGLSIVASCRICLAEIATPNPKTGELQKFPKLVPTCQQPAQDGTEVYLDSKMTRDNQKAVMEYLLINHPLDCPVCDQAGECYLQDYSYKYGRAYSRFEETKVKNPKKDVGPHVLLYSDRCIMCSRCVRFTREVTGTGELCVVGRGNQEEIDLFPGRALDNELSGNVVDICPVGALLDKEFLFEQRVWYLKSTPSIDGITASGDNIWVDHNEGRVWRFKPRHNPAVNKWWISDEIRYGWKFVHDRSRSPASGPTVTGMWRTVRRWRGCRTPWRRGNAWPP